MKRNISFNSRRFSIYDVPGRLQTVTHPDGAVTTFGYDKVGNRQSVTRRISATAPLFSTTSYLYDTLNRLTDITNSSGSNGLVSKYHYGLRPDGKRQSVTESVPPAPDKLTSYTYDDNGKLKQEAGPYATIVYGYDNVGNRLTRSVTGAATGGGTTLVNGSTGYAYDANDRITAQSGPGGMVNHSYDADGNETTVNGQFAAYDFEDHLVGLKLKTASAAEENSYDISSQQSVRSLDVQPRRDHSASACLHSAASRRPKDTSATHPNTNVARQGWPRPAPCCQFTQAQPVCRPERPAGEGRRGSQQRGGLRRGPMGSRLRQRPRHGPSGAHLHAPK